MIVAALVGVGAVALYRAVVEWEGPLAEGPYRHRQVERCVCK